MALRVGQGDPNERERREGVGAPGKARKSQAVVGGRERVWQSADRGYKTEREGGREESRLW